jgi:vesicle-fusing ATPase
MHMLAEAGFASGEDESMNGLHIGIKKLLSIIEMARQEPDHATERLVGNLMGLGM